MKKSKVYRLELLADVRLILFLKLFFLKPKIDNWIFRILNLIWLIIYYTKIKKTFAMFEFPTYWSLIRHHNQYTKEPTASERLVLVKFKKIPLIK